MKKAILNIIREVNLNEEPKWITYDQYYQIHKIIINTNSDNLNEDNLNKLISLINNMNIIDNNHNFIYENNKEGNSNLINDDSCFINNVNEDNSIISIGNSNSSESLSLVSDDDNFIRKIIVNLNNKYENKNKNDIINNDYDDSIPLDQTIKNKSNEIDEIEEKSNTIITSFRNPKKRKKMYPPDENSTNEKRKKKKEISI